MLWLSNDNHVYALPVDGQRWHIEHRSGHSQDGGEIVDCACQLVVVPDTITHINVIETAVEASHHQIWDGHVDDKYIGYRPHGFISCKIKSKHYFWRKNWEFPPSMETCSM